MNETEGREERVAKAICIASHFPPDCGWSKQEMDDFAEDHWRGCIREARAAIAAIPRPVIPGQPDNRTFSEVAADDMANGWYTEGRHLLPP